MSHLLWMLPTRNRLSNMKKSHHVISKRRKKKMETMNKRMFRTII